MWLPQVRKMPLFRRISLVLPYLSLRCDGPRHRLQNAVLHLISFVMCSCEINVWRKLRGMTRVFCAMCNAPYHESCMGKGCQRWFHAWPLLRTRVHEFY